MRVFRICAKGLTLIELIITMALGSVVLAIAVPGYRAYIQNSRATTLSSDFIAFLYLARSEAIKRGDTVSVCPTANVNMTACSTAVADWVDGWIVFVDSDDNGTIAADSDRIKTHPALATGDTISTTLSRVGFAGTGFPSAGQGTYTLEASGCNGNRATVVTLMSTGRVNATKATCTPEA